MHHSLGLVTLKREVDEFKQSNVEKNNISTQQQKTTALISADISELKGHKEDKTNAAVAEKHETKINDAHKTIMV